MNKDELKKLLIEKFDYPHAAVDIVANQVSAFSPMWRKAFNDYISHGVISNYIYENYTIQSLIDQMGLSPIGAFLTMDSLMKSPKETLKMLERGIR